MKRAFPNEGGTFLQDLAPCHTAKNVKFLEKNHIKVLTGHGVRPPLARQKICGV